MSIATGVPETAAAAVISNATFEHQQTVLGTLADIAVGVAEARLSAPMLIIVGEVTNLSSSPNWFERRMPLFSEEESPVFGFLPDGR